VACLFLVLVVLGGVLPRILLENILSNAFQSVVKIHELSLYPVLTAQSIYLYNSPRDAKENRPVLCLQKIFVHYTLVPKNGRFVTKVVADELRLNFEERSAEERNYEFVMRLIQAPPSKFDPLIFTPENITFKTINAHITTPSWQCFVKGLTAEISVSQMDDIVASINGNHLAGETKWTNEPARNSEFEEGFLDAVLHWRNQKVKLEPLKVHLPNILDGEARFYLKREPNETHVEWTIDKTSLAGPLASTFINTARSVGISLANLHIEQSSGKFLINDQEKTTVTRLSMDALLEQTSIEIMRYPLNLGNVHIQGNWMEESGDLQIFLDEQLPLLLTKDGPSLYRLTAQNWSRNDVMQILPASLQQRFGSWFPLWKSTSFQFSWDDQKESRVLSGQVIPSTADTKTDSKLHFKLVSGTKNSHMNKILSPATFEGSIQISNKQKPRDILEFTGTISDAAQRFDVSAVLKETSLDELIVWLPLNTSPSYLAGVFSGTASVSSDGSEIRCSLNLDGRATSLFGKPLPQTEATTLRSEFALRNTYESAMVKNVTLRCGRWLEASAAPFTLDLATGSFSLRPSARIDLDALSTTFFNISLHGILEVKAPVTYANKVISGHVDILAKDASIGSLSFTSEPPLQSKTPFEYDVPKGVLRVARSVWDNAPRMELSVEPFTFNMSEKSTAIPFSLHTNLSPFLDSGYLSKLENGSLQLDGLVQIAASTLQYEAKLTGSAALLGIRDDKAILSDTRVEGQLTQDGGQGILQCANLAAMGLNVSDLEGSWQYRDGVLKSDNLEGNLFGGKVLGVLSQEVFAPDLRGTLHLKIQQIDLERFTEEFKPKDIVLTGIGNGSLTATWREGQVQDLRMDLLTAENFSVNRSFLEWLLLSQYEQGKWSNKVFKTIRDKALGPASQHAFNSGQLTLEWRNHEYVGEVALKGKGLNLTITPRIDEGVITNALEFRQQIQIQDLVDSLGKAFREQ